MDDIDTVSAHNAGFEGARAKFYDFLDQFIPPEADQAESSRRSSMTADSSQSLPYYVTQLQQMQDVQKTTLYVNWEHLLDYDLELAQFIADHHHRVEPYLKKALQNLVRTHIEHYSMNEGDKSEKEFWVGFYNLANIDKLRHLRTEQIGKLRSFTGTVTRTSEVRPELFLASFRCMECNTVVHDVEQHFKWTTPVICTNETCGNRRSWTLVREQSKFVDWQKVKVQEKSDEVPAGSLPRTMEVILRNDVVELARAGDEVNFTGTLLVVPDIAAISAPGEKVQTRPGQGGFQGQGIRGPKMLGCRDLTYRLIFLACVSQPADQSGGAANIRASEDETPDEVYNDYTEDQQTELYQMKANAQIYRDLTKSIAPQVYGHDDIKRAVLLMLFGGVHKTTKEGIQLRGDINVAIVGDPSCGKSQILKYVASFLPRAVYTSGKSSSAAGLTASVVKESDSNEFCIEAGALMLADNGICCIDEFDKMDVKDQVAIHEAMEQQTISIAKAGIQATLNARTSILAAANPMGGRYDKSKPIKYNVALPPAILSRFDMMHVMIDEPDDDMDVQIATHIVKVHQRRERAFNVPYTMPQVQRYIKYARSIRPQMNAEARDTLVASYKQLRAGDVTGGAVYRITVRQLEALIRLSEAHARIRCSDVIEPRDVREAKRLVKSSIIAVESNDQEVDEEDFYQDNAEVADFVNAHRGQEELAEENTGEARMDIDELAGNRTTGAEQGAAKSQPMETETADAAQAAAAVAAVSVEPQQRQGTRVTQKKVDQVKTLFVQRLREAEVAGEAPGSSAAAGVSGLPQKELLSWYFDRMVESHQYQTTEELSKDYILVCKIVHHLIKRDNVLIVLGTPDRREDESNQDFAKRQQQERVLAVNPNYSAE